MMTPTLSFYCLALAWMWRSRCKAPLKVRKQQVHVLHSQHPKRASADVTVILLKGSGVALQASRSAFVRVALLKKTSETGPRGDSLTTGPTQTFSHLDMLHKLSTFKTSPMIVKFSVKRRKGAESRK